jgi:hypothetical protein
MTRTIRVVALAFSLFWPTVLSAQSLAEPTGKVLLEVSGTISETTDGKVARFDRALLEALGMETVETTTEWTDGMHRFAGPSVESVLDAVGASGDVLVARAINDYSVEIPRSFVEDHGGILAMTIDGEAMSRRDKGPIWLVFPRDTDPVLSDSRYNAYWIWQLDRIEVR